MRRLTSILSRHQIANLHVRPIYRAPEGKKKEYPRAYHELPLSPREIKPHPCGIEFGMLFKMFNEAKSRTF